MLGNEALVAYGRVKNAGKRSTGGFLEGANAGKRSTGGLWGPPQAPGS